MRQSSSLDQDRTMAAAMLIDAIRSWRGARDGHRSIQPCLARTLDAHGCALLAPLMDSLIRFYEAALGRPIMIGGAAMVSEDEHLLVGLVNGSASRACLGCPEGAANALHCALCSTRIMLALALGAPASNPQ